MKGALLMIQLLRIQAVRYRLITCGVESGHDLVRLYLGPEGEESDFELSGSRDWQTEVVIFFQVEIRIRIPYEEKYFFWTEEVDAPHFFCTSTLTECQAAGY